MKGGDEIEPVVIIADRHESMEGCDGWNAQYRFLGSINFGRNRQKFPVHPYLPRGDLDSSMLQSTSPMIRFGDISWVWGIGWVRWWWRYAFTTFPWWNMVIIGCWWLSFSWPYIVTKKAKLGGNSWRCRDVEAQLLQFLDLQKASIYVIIPFPSELLPSTLSSLLSKEKIIWK